MQMEAIIAAGRFTLGYICLSPEPGAAMWENALWSALIRHTRGDRGIVPVRGTGASFSGDGSSHHVRDRSHLLSAGYSWSEDGSPLTNETPG